MTLNVAEVAQLAAIFNFLDTERIGRIPIGRAVVLVGRVRCAHCTAAHSGRLRLVLQLGLPIPNKEEANDTFPDLLSQVCAAVPCRCLLNCSRRRRASH